MVKRVNRSVTASATLDLDAQLMLRVREGDEESFRVLLEKHRDPVIHYLQRMVQNDAVSEELAQEVFLRVYRARRTYQPAARFTTWLFRIATHLALNWLRSGYERARHRSGNESDVETALPEIADPVPSVEQ